jgi:UPF0271 protein
VRAFVLDTSAFIMGVNPSSMEGVAYSVPAVADELPERTMASLRFNTSRDSGKLIVKMPDLRSRNTIRTASSQLGEDQVLSEADRQILALALNLKLHGKAPTIVSDDYAIQNVAERLKLSYLPLATFGISYEFDWILFCPACFKKYLPGYGSALCRVCGTELKRKVLRKLRARARAK